MNNIILIILILLFSNINVFSQASKKNIFYVHGYTQDNTATVALGDTIETDNYFKNVFNPPTHLGYISLGPIGFETQEPLLTGQLNLANTNNWVGVGYSAGGLMARKIVQSQGVTPTPPPSNMDFNAFVTIATPNTGAFIAHNYGYFAQNANKWFTCIVRGEGTIVASFLHLFTWSLVDAIVSRVSDYQHSISKLSEDMVPNSSFLNGSNGLNNASNLQKEYSLKNGRGFLWGISDFKWKIGGVFRGKVGSSGYQYNIDLALEERAKHHRLVKKLNKGPWWKRAWHYPSRVWHRMRAGDWSAAIDGFKGLSNLYDFVHAPMYDGSDCFINFKSQIADGTGITNSHYREVNDLNNDGVYHGGMIDPNKGIDASNNLKEILSIMGY